MTADENINEPVVTIAGQGANESGSNDSWNATLNVTADLSEGTFAFNISFSDVNGNPADADVSTTTDGSSVTFDKTAPSLTTVLISSDNSNLSTYALEGDIVTIEFTSSEALATAPDVTIDNSSESVTTISATSYSVTRTMQALDTEGPIAFLISNIKNRAGVAASNVTTTTNGSSVTYDESAPILESRTISSNNSDSEKAKPGDIITLSIDANESIAEPTITIAGRSASVSGSGELWTGTYTMTAGESEGLIAYSISFDDIAGNSGSSFTNQTSGSDGSQVDFDKTAPILPTVTIASSNSDNTKAKPDDVITITIVSDESLSTPSVTIAGNAANVSGSGSNWSATYQMAEGDTEGTIAFSVAFSDVYGNSGTTVSSTTNGSAVTYDKTDPVLSTVTIASDNATTTLAKSGDEITLTILSDTDLSAAPNVKIAGNDAVVGTNSATSYTATYTMGEGDNNGTVTFNISNYSDLSGNTGSAVTSITAGSNVTFDKTAPTLGTVTITSDNSTSTRAKVGDEITLTIASAENIQEPTITIAGQSASVLGADDSWTATYTMTADESEGNIAFNINFLDLAGNSGTAVTTTTNASAVTFDMTAPTLPTVTIVSNNANDATLAKPDDVITLSITANEPIAAPTVTIGGGNAAVVNTSGNNYSATYTMTAASSDGVITFNIAFDDVTGNSGTAFTATTNGSSVTFDKTAPTLSVVTYTSDNANSNSVAKVGDEIILTIQSDTDLNAAPSVTISSQTADVTSTDARNYSAVYTMETGRTEGIIGFNISNFSDLAGNDGTAVNTLTAGTGITFDETAPVLSTVSIASDNALSSARAKVGDTVTLTLQSDGSLHVAPTITIAGSNAAISGSGIDYNGTYTMQADDTEGTVTFEVTGYTDLAGNVGTTVSAVTAGDDVVFNRTAPTLNLTLASNNANTAQAVVGDIVTLTITSSKNIQSPTVTLAGNDALVSGSNQNWTASYTMQNSDTEGSVSLNVVYADIYGNSGTTRTTTDDGSSVTFDKTSPGLTSVSISSNNGAGTDLAVPGNTVSISIQSNEPINPPEATIADNNAAITTHNSQNYTASYAMTTGASEGTIAFNIDFTDVSGNSGTAVSTTSDGSFVNFDKTAPTLTTVGIISENDNTAVLAAVGDTVTVNMVADQTLSGTPSVTFFGNAADYYTTNSGTDYSASYIVQSGDPEGAVTFNINAYSDVGGNTGPDVGVTTDGSSVEVDKSDPVVFDVTSVVPLGGTVVQGNWNNTNTSIRAVVPLEGSDNSLIGGQIQLQAKSGLSGSSFANVGQPVSLVEADLNATTVQVDVLADEPAATGIEEITPFLEENNLYFRAVFTDIVGNSASTVGASPPTLFVDTTGPSIDHITSTTEDGYYSTGDTVFILAVLVETVNISGTPRLVLQTGIVNMNGSTSDDTLYFDYIVGSTHNAADLDYLSETALELNSAVMRDDAGNDAVLTLPVPGESGSLSANKDINIDTTPPQAVISLSDSLVKLGDPCTIFVDFSEEMVNFPQVAIDFAQDDDVAAVDLTQEDDLTWRYNVTVPDSNDGTATITITGTDRAGNALTDGNTSGRNLLRLDNTDPVFSAVNIDTNQYINHRQLGWTLSEDLASGSIDFQRVSGPGGSVNVNLTGTELQSGDHDPANLTNDPALTDSTVYYLVFTAIDSAGNTGVTTVANVTYDITPPSASLVYSQYHTKANDVVTIAATFDESIQILDDIPFPEPSYTIQYNSGSGSSVSGGMTAQAGSDPTIFEFEMTTLDGVSNEGIVEISFSARDLAGNTIADDSIAFRDTLIVDNTPPSVTYEYSNLTQPSLSLLGKAGDVVRITANFDDQMRTSLEAPVLDITFGDGAGDTQNGVLNTSSTNTDSTWLFEITLPVGSINHGALQVSASGLDLAGNNVVGSTDDDIFILDNEPPQAFTTGTVSTVAGNNVTGWINGSNDSLAVEVDVDISDLNGTAYLGFAVAAKMDTSTTWALSGGAKSMSQAGTRTYYTHIDSLVAALNGAMTENLAQGDEILTRVIKYDRAGNERAGAVSTQKMIYDVTSPTPGSTIVWNTTSPDTIVSVDTLHLEWGDHTDPNSATASGIDRYEWLLHESGPGGGSELVPWSSVELNTVHDTTLPFIHDRNYTLSLRSYDVAGNVSDVTTVMPFTRINSAPVITAVDSMVVYEDIEYQETILVSDPDLATLNGDQFTYELQTARTNTMPPFPHAIAAQIDTNGVISWTPLPVDTATYDFTVHVDDAWGFSDTLLYRVTALAVNNTPVVDFRDTTYVLVEDSLRTVRVYLDQYISDEDNSISQLTWYDYTILDTVDNPGYPERCYNCGLADEFEQQSITPDRKFATLLTRLKNWTTGISAEEWAANPKLDITLSTSNDSSFATIVADTNYFGAVHRLVFYGRDTDGASGVDTLQLVVEARNDAPMLAEIPDQVILENDSLTIDLGAYAYDVDDSALTFTISALTNADSVTISNSDYLSTALGDSITITPDPLWSDSALIQLIVTDSHIAGDTATFNLDIIRVARPHLSIAMVQNSAFTNHFELIVTDTARKTVDCALTVDGTGINLDTVAAYTYVGRSTFESPVTFTLRAYAQGVVGDTAITRDGTVVLARSQDEWGGSSIDGIFTISGSDGAVFGDQLLLLVDSTLISPRGLLAPSYRLGAPGAVFAEAVQVMISGGSEEHAIHFSNDGVAWIELPTISRDGKLISWTDRMGYFRIGGKSLIVPEETALRPNYPNPFNPVTNLVYDIGFAGGPRQKVSLVIYDLLGREVVTLVKGHQTIGRHSIVWNSRNSQGLGVASGVYFVRMTAGEKYSETHKITLLR